MDNRRLGASFLTPPCPLFHSLSASLVWHNLLTLIVFQIRISQGEMPACGLIPSKIPCVTKTALVSFDGQFTDLPSRTNNLSRRAFKPLHLLHTPLHLPQPLSSAFHSPGALQCISSTPNHPLANTTRRPNIGFISQLTAGTAPLSENAPITHAIVPQPNESTSHPATTGPSSTPAAIVLVSSE
jgi:hypothetical protein